MQNDIDLNIEQIHENYVKLKNEYEKNSNINKNSVIHLLGQSGFGKSTLLHLFADARLSVIDSDPINSVTKFPLFLQIENQTFCDHPGFHDPEANQNFLNNCLIQKAFKDSDNSRIVLVINIKQLGERGFSSVFEENITNLETTFKFFPNFLDSICIVITKVKDRGNRDFLKTQLLKNLNPKSRILKYILEKNRIEIFRLTDSSEKQKEDKDNILRTIMGLSPLQTKDAKLNMPFSPEIILFLQEKLMEMKKSYYKEKQDKKKINEKLQLATNTFEKFNFFKECILAERREIEELSNEFLNEKKWYNILKEKIYEDSITYSSLINRNFDVLDSNNFLNTLRNIFSIENPNEFEPSDSSQYLLRIQEINTVFGEIKKLHKFQRDEDFILIGNFVVLSKILKDLKGKKRIIIYALNKFIIDCDIVINGTILLIYAKKWEIINEFSINLSGSKGPKIKKAGIGKVGDNGKPGENGGSFYGMGEVFIGLDRLRIYTEGGEGGDGQEGGNGYDGADGGSENFDYKEFSTKIVKTEVLYSEHEDITIYSAEKGKAGGDAGKGGRGGLEGNEGELIVYELNNLIKREKGKKGTNGSAGKDGKPGIGGRNYIYDKHHVFRRRALEKEADAIMRDIISGKIDGKPLISFLQTTSRAGVFAADRILDVIKAGLVGVLGTVGFVGTKVGAVAAAGTGALAFIATGTSGIFGAALKVCSFGQLDNETCFGAAEFYAERTKDCFKASKDLLLIGPDEIFSSMTKELFHESISLTFNMLKEINDYKWEQNLLINSQEKREKNGGMKFGENPIYYPTSNDFVNERKKFDKLKKEFKNYLKAYDENENSMGIDLTNLINSL